MAVTFTARGWSWTSITSLFEDMALLPGELFEEARQVFERMNLRLVGETHSRGLNKRNCVQIFCLESQFAGELGVPLNVSFRFLSPWGTCR